MRKITKFESLMSWFKRNYDAFKHDNHSWCNISTIITDEQIGRLKKFCEDRQEINLLIVIRGVNELRPQRTWGGLPEWFRNNTDSHAIYHYNNTYVFISTQDMTSQDNKDALDLLIADARDIGKQAEADVFIRDFHGVITGGKI